MDDNGLYKTRVAGATYYEHTDANKNIEASYAINCNCQRLICFQSIRRSRFWTV